MKKIITTLILIFAIMLISCETKNTSSNEKVIYLHIDYMVEERNDGAHRPHSHKPNEAALEWVKDAFKKQGITLDIDPVSNAIAESDVITFDTVNPTYNGNDAKNFWEIKSNLYKPRNKYEHYMIFAHMYGCNPYRQNCSSYGMTFDDSTGKSEGKYDSVVALGYTNVIGAPADAIQQIGALMHELGHNFGLKHGGDEDLDQKPNYVSVMNSSYKRGIGGTGEAERGVEWPIQWSDPSISYRVDYSDTVLSELDESSLNETLKLTSDNGEVNQDDVMIFYTDYGATILYANLDGALTNWNLDLDLGGNDIFDTSVSADINGDGYISKLHGFNDWEVILDFLEKEKQH